MGHIFDGILFSCSRGVCQVTTVIECASPEGVANAYIISDAPYYVGDRVRFVPKKNVKLQNLQT